MSCNDCSDKSSCGKKRSSCEQRLTLDYVPGASCTIGATLDGITSILDLKPAIVSCETKTHLQWNTDKCRLEFLNETYVASNGTTGFIESVEAKTIASCIKLKDLADVADTDPDNCDLLVYKKDPDCGSGCTGVADMWQPYTPPKVEQLSYVAGFNSEGCLVKLNDPTDPDTDPLGNNTSCRILVHSGNTSSWYAIPDGTITGVVGVNANGCLVKDSSPCSLGGPATVIGYKPVGYSGIFATSGEPISYGPTMGTPSYTNTDTCCRIVRLDAHIIVCAVPQDLGSYNVIMGMTIESNIADIGGKTTVSNYGHFSGAGLGGGSYNRLTAPINVTQTVKLNPGQTVNWTVRTWRKNFDGKTYDNDDGTYVTSVDPSQSDTWAVTSWRTTC